MKTSELTGALLDYWVARAEEKVPLKHGDHWFVGLVREEAYSPSANWAQGGPLIEKHIETIYENGGRWACRTHARAIGATGSTPLQAICRAVVRAAFGDEVGEAAC